MDPFEFQVLVWAALRASGYTVHETPRSHDGGVDGFLERAGRRGALQCKRYKDFVGVRELREFFGVLVHEKLDAGAVVTTGSITQEGRAFLAGKPIQVIEGDRLVDLLAGRIQLLGDFEKEEEW